VYFLCFIYLNAHTNTHIYTAALAMTTSHSLQHPQEQQLPVRGDRTAEVLRGIGLNLGSQIHAITQKHVLRVDPGMCA
jgi:hypothetical protein